MLWVWAALFKHDFFVFQPKDEVQSRFSAIAKGNFHLLSPSALFFLPS
jgi:hypothetical protein